MVRITSVSAVISCADCSDEFIDGFRKRILFIGISFVVAINLKQKKQNVLTYAFILPLFI